MRVSKNKQGLSYYGGLYVSRVLVCFEGIMGLNLKQFHSAPKQNATPHLVRRTASVI